MHRGLSDCQADTEIAFARVRRRNCDEDIFLQRRALVLFRNYKALAARLSDRGVWISNYGRLYTAGGMHMNEDISNVVENFRPRK